MLHRMHSTDAFYSNIYNKQKVWVLVTLINCAEMA